MNRKLKTLGVALFAALALTAVMASAATAAKYSAADYGVSGVTGTAHSKNGNDVFTTEAGNVECTSTFSATLKEASSDLTVTPTYTECKAFGFATATVTMHGCDYTFETPVAIGTHNGPPVNHTWTIPVEVKCPTGKTITVVAGNCEVEIHEQTPGGHVIAEATTNTLVDPKTPNDIDVKATITGITYTVVKDGFLCPFSGTGEKHGGTYTQKEAVTFHVPGVSVTIG